MTEPLAGPRSISPDASTAFAAVQFDASTADLGRDVLDALTDTAGPAESAEVQVEFGGELPTVLKERSEGPAEMIGIIAALIVLFFMFRSLVATVMPLGVAIVGLAAGLSIVGLLSGVIDIPSIAPRLGTMIGLGVGIDYALFLLSRHRDQLAEGMDVVESIARTNATAGQAVVVAGGTVMVAILGLQMAGIPFVAALGYSASIVVAVAVLVAITLLPALLGVAGRRVLRRSDRDGTVDDHANVEHSGWVRWETMGGASPLAQWHRSDGGARHARDPGARHASRPSRCRHRPGHHHAPARLRPPRGGLRRRVQRTVTHSHRSRHQRRPRGHPTDRVRDRR
ncbi:MAG: MMPL family transporter [Actinobacteria bacterium]|nr:MMPL family transporter [Actinomycetota bacterium]